MSNRIWNGRSRIVRIGMCPMGLSNNWPHRRQSNKPILPLLLNCSKNFHNSNNFSWTKLKKCQKLTFSVNYILKYFLSSNLVAPIDEKYRIESYKIVLGADAEQSLMTELLLSIKILIKMAQKHETTFEDKYLGQISTAKAQLYAVLKIIDLFSVNFWYFLH